MIKLGSRNILNCFIGSTKIKEIYLGSLLLWCGYPLNVLPEGYVECEYLESTGTLYIELPFGFYKTDLLNIKFSFTYNTGQIDKYVISPKTWNNNNNRFAIGMHKAINQSSFAYTCAYGSQSTGYTYLTPLYQYVPEMIVDVEYSDFLFTSTTLNNSLNVATINFGSETTNLKLFYGYNANTSCRIYEYKHKKNNKFVCDFIPALDLSGRPCLYDTVNKQAYYNNGTGEFLYKIKRPNILPEGYTQYDYLERGNNNAYIDTGLYANTNTEMEFDFMPLDSNGGAYFNLAGTYKVDGQFYMRMPCTSNSALFNLSLGVAATYYNTQNPTFRELNKRYVYKLNKDACYINGGKCKDFSDVDEFNNDGAYTIALFGIKGSGAFTQSMRVYGFKFRENGILTANYIPCKRDSDGVCGMYDLVSNTFKTSVNSNQFTCGNDSVLEGYTKYDYLAKTDYRQYIDTGLPYSDKTEVELGFKMITPNEELNSYTNLFGAGTPHFYLRYRFNGATSSYIGANNYANASAIYQDISQKYIYTLNKEGFYVNGNRIKAFSTVEEFTSDGKTLRLFNITDVANRVGLFQVYSLRIRENGELVADYIPVKRDSDGKCGMYDLVSGTFKTDVSGYGEMECGNDNN